jgi:hypothetical protein
LSESEQNDILARTLRKSRGLTIGARRTSGLASRLTACGARVLK